MLMQKNALIHKYFIIPVKTGDNRKREAKLDTTRLFLFVIKFYA